MSIKTYGLIGYPLSHSFSPSYFAHKFEVLSIKAQYTAYPLKSLEGFKQWFYDMDFSGLNVTIPYKQEIIPYLDDIDPLAVQIGAVNTIVRHKNRLIGYNTDFIGFRQSLINFIGNDKIIGKKALILGSGGSAQAVRVALDTLGITWKYVRRKGPLTYDDLSEKIMSDTDIIINTTPVGMSPYAEQCPKIPYAFINSKHFLFDLIYNPEKTLFLSMGSQNGAKIKNGLDMLYLQAEASWQYWTQNK